MTDLVPGDIATAGPVRLPRRPDEDGRVLLPASFAQRRLWPLQRFFPDSFAYNYLILLRIEGELDVAALRESVWRLVDRHESLRTALVHDTELRQRVRPVGAPENHPPMPVLPVVPDAGEDPWESARLDAIREGQEPFDLSAGPTLRASLRGVGARAHLLALSVHHAVFDGWSEDVLLAELAVCYSALTDGREPVLPELPVQHGDIAEWERHAVAAAEPELLAYWKNVLTGLTPLDLRTDRPRPARPAFRGAAYGIPVPAATVTALRSLCREQHVSFYIALVAVVAAAMGRWARQDDVPVAVQVANRPLPAAENVLGFLVNGLVLRTDLGGNPSFADLLEQVFLTFMDGLEHQGMPFERLAEVLEPGRDLSRTPLAQVAVALDRVVDPAGFAGLRVSRADSFLGVAKWELAVTFRERGDELTAIVTYDTDLFDETTIARLTDYLVRSLTALAEEPDRPVLDVPLVVGAERARLVEDVNRTRTPFPDRSIQELFEEQVASAPDAPAVHHDGGVLSYAELNSLANTVAHGLLARGIGLESRVGLCLRRSPEAIAAILGVLKSGAAYVPLAPDHPPERLRLLVADSGAAVVLTDTRSSEAVAGLPGTVSWADITSAPATGNPPRLADGRTLAHVVYTSGSTGKPNPVGVEQRSIGRLVRGARFHEFGRGDVCLHLSPLTFDASLVELWGPLLNGGAVVIPPGDAGTSAILDQIRAAVDTHPVTMMQLIAPQLNLIVEHAPELLSSIRTLFVGGDVVDPAAVSAALDHVDSDAVLHMYGPTESTLFATFEPVHAVRPGQGVLPIGRPIGNTTVYVVDPGLRPVPAGVPGELLLGGAGLARGYLGRPALTAERFVPDPFSGERGARLYRTGDLVRFLADGRLEFLGRIDGQVKLRGFRVETGEVASALRAHPDVDDAVVLLRSDLRGGPALVGYAVARPGAAFEPAVVDRYLREVLPAALVPAYLIAVPEIPLTGNAKVDRAALPLPDKDNGADGEPPSSGTEKRVAKIWLAVTGAGQVARDTPFFAAGGNSLLLVGLAERLGEEFGALAPSVVELFDQTTVRRIAAFVDGQGRTS
ncbi:amino acid adenylation domain-containing protein [Amycolatopsis thailandensis]|uniref:non-ribosomal peptide synthetase n=1 Tax=Amycolatopsis thailandensis TaxID=589330 RepID=UPI0036533FA4